MRKYAMLFLLAFLFLFLAFAAPNPNEETKCLQFLSELGWETCGECTSKSVRLPQSTDKVWAQYLAMQAEFPLADFSMQEVTQYTVEIKNHPQSDAAVYAHVYMKEGRILGGDIMSNALSGFMHPLLPHAEIQK